MTISTHTGVWSIAGEMTIYNAAALKQTLLEKLQQSSHLDIRLAQVTEIDTAGFQLLLLAKREAEIAHKTVHLRDPSSGVADVLTTFHAHHLITENHP